MAMVPVIANTQTQGLGVGEIDVLDSSVAVPLAQAGLISLLAYTSWTSGNTYPVGSVVQDGPSYYLATVPIPATLGAPATDATGQWRIVNGPITLIVPKSGITPVIRLGASPAITAPPAASGTAPFNTVPPAIVGSGIVGNLVTVSTGQWIYVPEDYSFAWYRNGVAIGVAYDYYTIAEADLGTNLTAIVTAVNSAGSTPATTAALMVGTSTATAPGAPTGVVATAGTTTASVAFVAPSSDGGATITSYLVSASTGQTAGGTTSPITITGLTAGVSVTFTVVASNSAGIGPASAPSAPVTPTGLSSTLPTITYSSLTVYSTLSTTTGTYTNDPTSYGYQWAGNGSPISGANAASYILQPSDLGTTITCTVTANGTGTPSSQSATTAGLFIPSPPVWLTDSPPTTGTIGDAYTYTFSASGSPAPVFAVAAGALPPGLTLNPSTGVLSGDPTTVGVSTFTVSAANSGGTVTTVSISITVNAVVLTPVSNSVAPTITDTTSGTATVSVADVLDINDGTWAGSPTFAYQWLRTAAGGSAVHIMGATNATYTVQTLDVGATLSCTVTGSNTINSVAVTTAVTAAVAMQALNPINIAYAGTNGTNGITNIAALEAITGVTYTYAHVYCDAASSWTDFSTAGGGLFFTEEGGNRYDQWVAAVPGRNLMISPGMIPASQSDPISITTLGCLSGTGTGTFVSASYGANWPTTGSFQMEIFDTVNELVTVTAQSGVSGAATMTVTARGVAGSTAGAHNTGKTCDYDWRVPAAAGTFNTYWTTWGEAIVAAGLGNSIIRLGHECNYPGERHWIGYIVSQQQNWALYYQQVVTTLNAVSGANFTYEFNMNAGYLAETITNFYPGDAYVDWVGIDQYDSTINTYSGASGGQWAVQLNGQGSCGLAAILAFAAAHAKPMAYSEWGLEVAGTQGFGDDPAYINNMASLMNGQAPPSWSGGPIPPCHHQSLFNPLAVSSTGVVTSTWSAPIESYPNSLAAYIADFAGAPPPAAPTIVTAAAITGAVGIDDVLTATATFNGATTTTYQWSDGGTNISGATSATYTPTANGTYTVTVTGTNSAGSTPSTSPAVVVGSSGPTVTTPAAISGTAAINDTLSVIAYFSGATSYTYQWDDNGTNISGGTYSTYTPTTAGVYTATVTGWSGAGGTGNSTPSTAPPVTVSSGGPAVTTAATISGTLTVNSKLTAVAYFSGATSFRYQWLEAGTAITGATYSTYTPAAAGTYSCIVTGVDASGSTPSQSPAVTVTGGGTVTAPTNTALPVITDNTSGSATISVDDSVTVSTGTWD
jgi:Fibronectin type III domain/PKD domain/Glycosyl hydrolase family 26